VQGTGILQMRIHNHFMNSPEDAVLLATIVTQRAKSDMESELSP
jgi:hypothetical protein